MQRSLFARATLQFLLGILPCLLSDSILTMSRGSAAEGTPDKTIDQLIADLGSDRFETREAARRAGERVEAIPALRKARRSADIEVRRRVEDILLALDRKRASRGLVKAKALGNAGRVVEVADRLAFAAKNGVPGEEGWESLTQFADLVIKRAEGYFTPNSGFHRDRDFPAGEFRRYAKLVNPKEIAERGIEIDTGKERDNPRDVKGMAGRKFIKETGGKLLLRGEEVSLTGCHSDLGIRYGMIAASEDVTSPEPLAASSSREGT